MLFGHSAKAVSYKRQKNVTQASLIPHLFEPADI